VSKDTAPIRRQPDGAVTLSLHVQPGAKRTDFAGLHGEADLQRLAMQARELHTLGPRLHVQTKRHRANRLPTNRYRILAHTNNK